MAQKEVMMRQSAIIKKLKVFPATFAEIDDYLKQRSEIHGYNFNTSKRTFQRDIEDIHAMYGIAIIYDFSKKKYLIQQKENEEHHSRTLEAFDTYNALNLSAGFSGYLEFENRKSAGLDHFLGLLHAIKNRQQVNFSYQTYWDAEVSIRKAAPCLLKEFKNRWYLIAKDLAKDVMRTYGLDRITELEITKKKVGFPSSQNVEDYFKHSFGIITGDGNKEPQTIILSFDEHQAKYIKSLPLHASQQIVKDDETELIIKLEMYITFDFEMELLSYGASVEVIEPSVLRASIKNKLIKALKYYS